MPLNRTSMRDPVNPVGGQNIIDLSDTINATSTHQQQTAPENMPNYNSTGTVPKMPNSAPNFLLPPPCLPHPTKQQHIVQQPNQIANLVKGLIADANMEFQSRMEKAVDDKLEKGFKVGFSELVKELRKMNLGEQAGLRKNSTSSEEMRPMDDAITRAPTKKKPTAGPYPQRNLFPESDDEDQTDHHIDSHDMRYREERTSESSGSMRGRIFVDKWDLVFDGNAEHLPVEDFIYRVEYLRECYGCSWEEVMRDFQRLLKGEAKEWYWMRPKAKKFKEWKVLKHALLVHYGSHRSNYEYMRELEERRQRPGESIDSFFHATNRLRARLRMELPEFEMIRILKRNLRQGLAQIIYPMNIYTVEQLRDECKEVEKNILRRDYSMSGPSSRAAPARKYVDELSSEQYGESEEEEIEEINQFRKAIAPKEKVKEMICWNCEKNGHLFNACPSIPRRKFCYKCGKPGVSALKCPHCTGNVWRGATKTGESRSTQTPEEA